jgi:hypothetical protein
MLVPIVGPNAAQPDAPVRFISIIRRLREVSLATVQLNRMGVIEAVPFVLPDQVKTSPLLADVSFVNRAPDMSVIRTMLFIPEYAGWSAQFASLAFVAHASIFCGGAGVTPLVEGYYSHAPVY